MFLTTKHCPHCKKEINLLNFLKHYGSDSLVPAKTTSRQVHPREHVCLHCHKKFWIHYNPHKFAVLSRKYLIYLILISLGGWTLGQIFHFSTEQSVGLAGVLFLVALPVYVTYIKYQGMDLRPEN